MTYQDKKQIAIEQAIKNKEKRMDKTSLSILISWAINCALATLSDAEKSNWQKLVKERKEWFIEEYRNFMLDNMPIEPNGQLAGKLTEEQIKSQSEGQKWQDKYNQMSEIDTINAELAATE